MAKREVLERAIPDTKSTQIFKNRFPNNTNNSSFKPFYRIYLTSF